jgi:hypothetical protein
VNRYGATRSQGDTVTIVEMHPKVALTVTPNAISEPGTVQVQVTATDLRPNPAIPINGVQVALTTTAGAFTSPSAGQQINVTTSGGGQANATLLLDPPASATVTATFTDSCGVQRLSA